MRTSHLVLSGLLVATCGALACGGGELPPPFPLAWAGVESTPSLTERGRTAVSGKSFRLEKVVDRRADKTKVGVDEESNYQFHTTTNVSDFASDRVKQLLGDSGLKLADTGEYVIQAELVEFTVKEGNDFAGDVRVLFRVFKVGSPAFENTYLGKAQNHGRTHSTDNINEALSAAMLSAVSQFLHDEALATYFEKGPPGGAPAGSAAAPAASAPAPKASAPAPKASAAPGPRKL